VFDAVRVRIQSRVTATVTEVRTSLARALRVAGVVGWLIVDATRTRAELLAENARLRRQLIVAARSVRLPIFRAHERGLLVLLARLVPGWRDALNLLKPETLLRWHREGSRLLLSLRLKRPTHVTSRVDPRAVELIGWMVRRIRNGARSASLEGASGLGAGRSMVHRNGSGDTQRPKGQK